MEKRLPPLPAHPWSYNPSSWGQRIPIAIGALLATFIALYLGLYQWRIISSVWDPFFGDGTVRVLDSDVSRLITSYIRVPDAILGALAYLSDIVFAMAGSERRWQDRPWLVILFGLDVIPLGAVSIILVLLQGIVVKAWCFLCLVTALISLILIFLAYDEVYTSLLYLYEIWKTTKSGRLVWDALWGRPSVEAYEAGLAIAERRYRKKNVG